MRKITQYVVIFAMIAVAMIGLPIIFPYNKKPHFAKSDHIKTSLVVDA